MGAEDVVVDDRRARLDRHRGRQRLPGRAGRVGGRGSATPAAARWASSCSARTGCWSPTPDAGLLAMSTHHGRGRAAGHRGRRAAGWSSATTPRSPRNGDIWFSDSSTVYPIEQWKADFVEHTETGRLLCRRADGTVEVHLDGLAFANGVALAADESFVCVAESVRRTVVRLWLTGERAGTTRPARRATCPATPTTSRAAATA